MKKPEPESGFSNVYEDDQRAEAYDALEFPGTYYLAYRDLPAVIGRHVTGRRALDFGCGTGRSTRFLAGLGFDVVGVDISSNMLERARRRDAGGDYRLVADGDLSGLAGLSFDLILSVFTFDNIPTREKKIALFDAMRGLLDDQGRIVSLVSSPAIYVNEWASFSTRDFPENRQAQSGDAVRIVMLDVPDSRPVVDILWTDEAYAEVYRRAQLRSVDVHRPLGTDSEPYPWVSETRISPWVIWTLERDPTGSGMTPSGR